MKSLNSNLVRGVRNNLKKTSISPDKGRQIDNFNMLTKYTQPKGIPGGKLNIPIGTSPDLPINNLSSKKLASMLPTDLFSPALGPQKTNLKEKFGMNQNQIVEVEEDEGEDASVETVKINGGNSGTVDKTENLMNKKLSKLEEKFK